MTFWCRPLSAALSESTCAAQHVAAERARSGVASGGATNACHRCPVGQAHARAERPERWPDGEQLVRLSSAPRRGEATSKPQASRLELVGAPAPAPTGKLYTYNGVSRTLGGWARALGIRYDTMRKRVDRHSLREAIEMGGAGGRRTSSRSRQRGPALGRLERALRAAGFVVVAVEETDGALIARCAR